MALENDVVIIYYEDKPLTFARIETILADHKKDWYHVTLLLLQLPLQTVTWILKNIYINGEEFTMDGKRMRLEVVVNPDDTASPQNSSTSPTNKKTKKNLKGAKVISLKDIKKR
ncbi:hypothetical protein QUF75_11955 [Desulfococcaceae bacterium HSG7]|nr:hypothetical protein [Desulfococcaceae bacterium HSG9]MDM8555437.1 hypothetical protein [Desulfococcaceae bacterium HSG7]